MLIGIASDTIVTTIKGNNRIENCAQTTLVSRYDVDSGTYVTASVPSSHHYQGEGLVYKLITDTAKIEATENCLFLCDDGKFRELFDIPAGSSIMTVDGPVKANSIESKRKAPIYGIRMQSQHTFIANSLILKALDAT